MLRLLEKIPFIAKKLLQSRSISLNCTPPILWQKRAGSRKKNANASLLQNTPPCALNSKRRVITWDFNNFHVTPALYVLLTAAAPVAVVMATFAGFSFRVLPSVNWPPMG